MKLMSHQTKLGLGIVGVALLLGMMGDGLLRAAPWGLNISLWMSALGTALAVSIRSRKEALGGGAWLFAPVIIFSAALAWHDSIALKLLNLLAILIALALLMLRAQGGRLVLAEITEYAGAGIVAAVNVALGPVLLVFGCIRWQEIFNGQSARRSLAIGRGLAISLPLLLLFGGLLMGADAVFSGIVSRVIRVDFLSLLSHSFMTAFFGWIVAGFLRGTVIGSERNLAAGLHLPSPRLGIVELGIALGLLDLLFFSFVLVQIHYLFGGAPLVGITPGLTYAEYARSGFFELIAVAALVLPLLLLAHWLLRREDPAHERLFRALAGLQILLLFVIMASAVQRMRLYESEYGLTEDRLYPTAFMGWLAVVFIWFAATVLRGHRERFAFGALIAGFLLIGALQVLNPDLLVARTNTARAAAGRKFDAGYAGSLGADAVPALVSALPALSPHDRCIVAKRVLADWTPPSQPDWRTWSWSRMLAWRSVSANRETLRQAAGLQHKEPEGPKPCAELQ